MRWVLRSKIHQAKVTETRLDYVGSLTIDQDLIERAGFWPGEKILVVSNTTGARLETYVIAGPCGSGVIGANGAAARLMQVGDELIIMGFELSDHPIQAKIILLDEHNHFLRYLE
jgi:aspartate 1-decarboxylase